MRRVDRAGVDCDVLVVGAGPSGLMTSLLLGRQGVRTIVVEKRSTQSLLPRALGINVRSMEIFRSLGIAEDIRRTSRDVRGLPFVVDMDTLRGPVRETVPFQASGDPGAADSPSPEHFAFCAQNQLEPILQATVEQSGMCDVWSGMELVDLSQDDAGIAALVRERSLTLERSVRANFLVAGDGAHSTVREALGIRMRGHDHLTRELNILVDADLTQALGAVRAVLYQVRHPWRSGTCLFRNVDGRNRWSVVCEWFDDPSPARCTELIRLCAQDPRLAVDVLGVGEWERAAMLADRFQAGRVFLIGDAAHRVTPAGAFGMNTGIQDAHNLAWKLALVLKGRAMGGLLATYQAERRPWTASTVDLSYRLTGQHRRAAAKTLGHVLGQAYDVGALISDGSAPPDVQDPIAEYAPSARPGRRAPHQWVNIDGRRVSTLDFFGKNFVLLSGSEAWCSASRGAAAELGVEIDAHVISESGWKEFYEVGTQGAVLVRPDGHVAWRTREPAADGPGALTEALARILEGCGTGSSKADDDRRGDVMVLV